MNNVVDILKATKNRVEIDWEWGGGLGRGEQWGTIGTTGIEQQ